MTFAHSCVILAKLSLNYEIMWAFHGAGEKGGDCEAPSQSRSINSSVLIACWGHEHTIETVQSCGPVTSDRDYSLALLLIIEGKITRQKACQTL